MTQHASRLPWILFATWGLALLIGVVVIGSWIIQSGRSSEASQLAGANDTNPTLVFALTAIAALASEVIRMTKAALNASLCAD